MSAPFSFVNSTKAKLPSLAFANTGKIGQFSEIKKIAMMEEMKNAVLGKRYSLHVVIATSAHIKKLNAHYRNIDKPTDILSFPLSKTEGEIYINLAEAKKEAKKFDRTYENFLPFLFIHGLVHLKGFDHGSTMERIETRFRKKFGI